MILELPPQPILVLVMAAGLDYLMGDPWGWPHPVRVMGWAIAHYQKFVLSRWQSPLVLRLAGVILGIGLVGLSAGLGGAIVKGSAILHPVLGIVIESILLATCLAGRSLRNAALEVLQPLGAKDLDLARSRLSQYVGRDTAHLSESEVLRAVLETVTENAIDGVLAPLFYAILGSILPGVGSVPLALAYKASSTLDSMVGYRTPPYRDLGWFSARMDDGLTWLPCRLAVLSIALLSGKPRYVWRICQRDAIADPSPNSGWSECVYAAALDVQVGGLNWYQGIPKPKPLLGEPIQEITPGKIHQALQLTRTCFLIWLGIAMLFGYWFLL